MTKTGEHTGDWFGKPQLIDDYDADYINREDGSKFPCLGLNNGKVEILASLTYIRCFALFDEIVVNLSNMRFLSSYMIGYLDGMDDNSNTPSIDAGICVKINE